MPGESFGIGLAAGAGPQGSGRNRIGQPTGAATRGQPKVPLTAAAFAVQPLLDPLLGGGQLFRDSGLHSKSSLVFGLVNR